jgi:hypothetical protein
LEQQTLDDVIYEEGVIGSGMFYSENESTNLNGSYKRLIHNQIKQAFYNDYRDPTKLLGLENIDIGLSGTKRFISDRIRVFTVPRSIFGEKILEGSVELTDNALDDRYVVTDDYNSNLNAGDNLFSKRQALGSFYNYFATGSTSVDCPSPITGSPATPTNLTAFADAYNSVSVTWDDNATTELGFYLYRYDYTGSYAATWRMLQNVTMNAVSTTDTAVAQTSSYAYKILSYNELGTSSFSNTSIIITPAGP